LIAPAAPALLNGEFEPEKFADEYENELKELLRKKQKGERIERPKEPSRTNVVNLMDAPERQGRKQQLDGAPQGFRIIGGQGGKEVIAPGIQAAQGRLGHPNAQRGEEFTLGDRGALPELSAPRRRRRG
jgi:hypothetical protein